VDKKVLKNPAKPRQIRERKYSTSSRQGYAISPKTIKTDPKIIESSRNSIFLRPLLTALATDIAGLEWNCVGDGWQKSLFTINETKLIRTIVEMCTWAWTYGESYSDIKWGLAGYQGQLYNVPTGYLPVDMSKLKKQDDQTITIDKTILNKREILRIQFFTESGTIFSMGQMYGDLIAGLEFLLNTWFQSTGSNALGALVLKQSQPGIINTQAMNDINLFMDAHGKFAGSSIFLPPGVDATILASPARPDFEKPMGYGMFLLLSSLRSQWAMSSITSPGTYGTTESQRSSYQNYVNNLADLVQDGLNEHYKNVALINGESYKINITHSKAADTKSLGYEFMAALRGIIELTPFFNDDQKKSLYSMLGIPEPTQGQSLPVIYQQTTTNGAPAVAAQPVAQASRDNVIGRLNNKKSAIYVELLKRIERVKAGETGLSIHLSVSGAETLARDMNIPPESMPDFRLMWSQMQEAVNNIIKMYDENDDIQTTFDSVWKVFETGVLKWAR